VSDYTLPPCSTLIVGMTGSGKTTFALRALINVPCACRFVFDDLGQASARLSIPHAATSHELEAALQTKWVLFNPHRMFPGEVEKGFEFFCDWTYQCSTRAAGKKILLVDEVWRFCSPHAIPKPLAMCTQAGRAEGIHLMVATQLPHKIHASITGQATELVCFRLQEPLALDKVEELGADRNQVAALPLGHFVAINRLSGQSMTGRVF
jgi:hypothetical protein